MYGQKLGKTMKGKAQFVVQAYAIVSISFFTFLMQCRYSNINKPREFVFLYCKPRSCLLLFFNVFNTVASSVYCYVLHDVLAQVRPILYGTGFNVFSPREN